MIEGIDLEINDLFENNHDAERDREDIDEDSNKNKNGETSAAAEIKPRRIVRNPQPKLNPERLAGSRGLVQLPKIFSEVILKGEGNEKENLDVVLKTLEHWSYRLFPRFPFEDVLEKIEKLGEKKPVQTCLKKIRLDMLTEDDFAPIGDNVDSDGARADLPDSPRADPQAHDDFFDNITDQSASAEPDLSTHSPRTPVNSASSVPTDERSDRMERNRQLAMERRALKLQQQAQQSAETESFDLQLSEEVKDNDAEQQKANETEMLNEDELLSFLEDDL